MPAQAQWLRRLDDILAQLAHFPAPVLDRAAMEELFGVGRRRAIQLLHEFGGWQAGRTFLIETRQLEAGLRRLQSSAPVQAERRRRQRLAHQVDAARLSWQARRVVIAPQPGPSALDSLPACIGLEPGLLRVEFQNTRELLELLYRLSRTLLEDFPAIEARLGSVAAEPSGCLDI